jgi:hypothetical protein
MTCRDFFESSELVGKDFSIALDKAFPKGVCELEIVSEHSPGRVEDDELLNRLVFHPIDIDEFTGEVSPTAFDDVLTSDLSTLRERYSEKCAVAIVSREKIDRGASKVPPQERRVIGIFQAKVLDLRSILNNDGEKMFAVYDTARRDVPSHASVFVYNIARSSRPKKREVRQALYDLFAKNRVSLNY